MSTEFVVGVGLLVLVTLLAWWVFNLDRQQRELEVLLRAAAKDIAAQRDRLDSAKLDMLRVRSALRRASYRSVTLERHGDGWARVAGNTACLGAHAPEALEAAR